MSKKNNIIVKNILSDQDVKHKENRAGEATEEHQQIENNSETKEEEIRDEGWNDDDSLTLLSANIEFSWQVDQIPLLLSKCKPKQRLTSPTHELAVVPMLQNVKCFAADKDDEGGEKRKEEEKSSASSFAATLWRILFFPKGHEEAGSSGNQEGGGEKQKRESFCSSVGLEFLGVVMVDKKARTEDKTKKMRKVLFEEWVQQEEANSQKNSRGFDTTKEAADDDAVDGAISSVAFQSKISLQISYLIKDNNQEKEKREENFDSNNATTNTTTLAHFEKLHYFSPKSAICGFKDVVRVEQLQPYSSIVITLQLGIVHHRHHTSSLLGYPYSSSGGTSFQDAFATLQSVLGSNVTNVKAAVTHLVEQVKESGLDGILPSAQEEDNNADGKEGNAEAGDDHHTEHILTTSHDEQDTGIEDNGGEKEGGKKSLASDSHKKKKDQQQKSTKRNPGGNLDDGSQLQFAEKLWKDLFSSTIFFKEKEETTKTEKEEEVNLLSGEQKEEKPHRHHSNTKKSSSNSSGVVLNYQWQILLQALTKIDAVFILGWGEEANSNEQLEETTLSSTTNPLEGRQAADMVVGSKEWRQVLYSYHPPRELVQQSFQVVPALKNKQAILVPKFVVEGAFWLHYLEVARQCHQLVFYDQVHQASSISSLVGEKRNTVTEEEKVQWFQSVLAHLKVPHHTELKQGPSSSSSVKSVQKLTQRLTQLSQTFDLQIQNAVQYFKSETVLSVHHFEAFSVDEVVEDLELMQKIVAWSENDDDDGEEYAQSHFSHPTLPSSSLYPKNATSKNNTQQPITTEVGEQGYSNIINANFSSSARREQCRQFYHSSKEKVLAVLKKWQSVRDSRKDHEESVLGPKYVVVAEMCDSLGAVLRLMSK